MSANQAQTNSGLRSRFRRGFTWNVISAIFTQGSTFILNIVVANMLDKETFGQYSMIYGTLLAFAFIAQVATGYTSTKYIAEFRSSQPEKAGRILGLCSAVTVITGGIATLILFSGASWISTIALKSPDLSLPLMIGAGYIYFSVINGYQIGALAGLESYKTLAIANVPIGILHIAIVSGMVWIWDLNGAFAGFVLSSLVRWYSFHILLKREGLKQGIRLTYRGIAKERSIIFNFAVPAALPILTTMPAVWFSNAFLARTPGGFSELALYSAAANAKTLVVFLPSLLNRVCMSLLNNQKGLGDERRYRKVYWTNLLLVAAVATMGAIFVAAIGKPFLSLYGDEFLTGYYVLVVMIISAVFESTTLAAYQIIPSQEKMWLSFFIYALPRDVLLVTISYYLVSDHGALGLSAAYACSWLVVFLIVSLTVYVLGFDISKNK